MSSVEAIAKAASVCDMPNVDKVVLYIQDGRNRTSKIFDGTHFFLRTSFEYSSPQVTLEELQGMVAARLLEVSSNYMLETGVKFFESSDIDQICEALAKPPCGTVIPFSLQTDDIEPDRYSNNPLRKSIVESGRSAFPVAYVTTEGLSYDRDFLEKYKGSLVTEEEFEFGKTCLEEFDRYVDFVDYYKRWQFNDAATQLGICLNIPTLRMPLETLIEEGSSGPLHSVIERCHDGYDSLDRIYRLMGRNINKKKTLLPTVPHSRKGYGSKRCARGRLVFSGKMFSLVKVKYETSKLYPNMADPNDVSIAVGEDMFELPADRFVRYSYAETPTSPQFALYILLSPEDASIWHGVGAFEGSDILKSYSSVQSAFFAGEILQGVKKVRRRSGPALAFNLVPEKMWRHPIYENIDASIGCVSDLRMFLSKELKVTQLHTCRGVRGIS
ncbi:MAG: hypothetical protein QXG97_07775 [Nitrososphaerota archaeon]